MLTSFCSGAQQRLLCLTLMKNCVILAQVLVFVEGCILARVSQALVCHKMHLFPHVVSMNHQLALAQVMHWTFLSSSAHRIHQFTGLGMMKGIQPNGNLEFLCSIMILIIPRRARTVKRVVACVVLLVWTSHLLVFVRMGQTAATTALDEVSSYTCSFCYGQ